MPWGGRSARSHLQFADDAKRFYRPSANIDALDERHSVAILPLSRSTTKAVAGSASNSFGLAAQMPR